MLMILSCEQRKEAGAVCRDDFHTSGGCLPCERSEVFKIKACCKSPLKSYSKCRSKSNYNNFIWAFFFISIIPCFVFFHRRLVQFFLLFLSFFFFFSFCPFLFLVTLLFQNSQSAAANHIQPRSAVKVKICIVCTWVCDNLMMSSVPQKRFIAVSESEIELS